MTLCITGGIMSYSKQIVVTICGTLSYFKLTFVYQKFNQSLRGVVVSVLDSDIIVNEFDYYVHFRTNIIREGMNTLIPVIYGLNSTTNILQ